MNVIVELAIFPMDKGESVSKYVARVSDVIRNSGLKNELNPMGTCIEGRWDEVMSVVTACYKVLETDCDRIYMTMKADCRKGVSNRMKGKINSVESKL